MADTFEKILVKDDKIGCLTNKVKYQVTKGGQNITAQPFKAISETPTAHVYNITVPSLETIISREVLWQSTVTLLITGTNKPNGQYLVNYGVTDALAPFPLHSLVTNMTATINNNTVSMNVQDTLPVLLRMLDAEEMAHYECMTPTTLDTLSSYRDAVEPMPYILESYNNGEIDAAGFSYPPGVAAQAERAPTAAADGVRVQSFKSYADNSLSYDRNRPSGSSWYHKPRGSWKLIRLAGLAGDGTYRRPLVTDNVIYATFKVTEPLLLSPFVFGHPEGKQGFYGIQTMNFQMNLASNASRAWRASQFGTFTKSATVLKTENSQLIFTFLTPHASDMLEPRNVVPYYEMPIYRTSNFADIPSIGPGVIDINGSFIASAVGAATTQLQSSNIQLNCVPDKLIIFVRKAIGNLTCCDTDSYLTINQLSLNWNNQSGLLSSMTPEQLYRASVLSGLGNLTWDEFTGSVVSNMGTLTSNLCDDMFPYGGCGAKVDTGVGIKLIPTTGSILVLDFASVIQLTEEYYAPGSLGSFNLQLSMQVTNNHSTAWGGGTYELVIMPLNSGVFVNEKGTSSTFIALLTKEDVIQASSQEPYTQHEIKRMIGGSFMSGLKSSLGWLHSKMPWVKGALGTIDHPMAKTGHDVLHALGYGKGKLADRLM